MNNYTVYIHTNKTNNKKYIGITSLCPEERWQNGNGYSRSQKVFYQAIQKYGWDNFDHEIVYTNLTEEEAKEKEQELIKYYNTYIGFDNCMGYNMTLGGEGVQKVESNLINKLWNKGYSELLIAKELNCSTRTISRKLESSSNFSFEEAKKRGNILSKGRTGKIKTICQYNLNGDLIKIYSSISEASRETNICQSNISRNASGCGKTAGGFIWKFIEKEEE